MITPPSPAPAPSVHACLKAMRAVLDRPLRSNFVTVSTAVNRVAKLAAERRRGGGLKGDDEPKYLGILLKVDACLRR